jgi:glycosyltransferase involved in cell wall biosynthesis
MKVLQVTPFFGEQYGGCERYAYNLSRELAKLGHEVEVFTARMNRLTSQRSNIEGVRVHRFYTPKVVWNINPINFMLHRLLTAEHDIVHVHSYLYFSSNQAVLAKILRSIVHRRTRLLLHIHGGVGEPSNLRLRPYKRVLKTAYDFTVGRLSMRAADHIVSADEANARAAAKVFHIPRSRLSIIYNGINLSEFAKFSGKGCSGSSEKHEILYVGDLEPWKGVQTLIETMRVLQANGNAFTLKLAGEGSQRHRLEALANGVGVEFLGEVPHAQIPEMMSRAFAVVLPSLWEACPTVGLEAMATGTPFIGTNVGGIPEIVRQNVTGLLVPPNRPAELASAILRLSNDRLRQKLTTNALRLVQTRFDIARVARKVDRLYRNILTAN